MPQPVLLQDLGTAIDKLHCQLGVWERERVISPPLDEVSAEILKLAIHEWVANLVQHAHFDVDAPLIRVGIEPCAEHVACVIEDNSRGFDFDLQIARQREAVAAPMPPDRGRGLLMLIACTDGLHYHQPELAGEGAPAAECHRLEFSISASKRPWIDVPF